MSRATVVNSGGARVGTRAPAERLLGAAWPALVPAAAVPILFLHVRYQPGADVGLGSTTIGIELSDVAVLAVVLTAGAIGTREGWAPLRAARGLWLTAAVFLAVVLAATVYPLLRDDAYRFLTHAVTAAKFCEYALLAPALVLLLRRREDALPLLWSVAAWSAAASAWGLLQFAGLVDEFEGKRPLQREPSFLGIHDLAALSGAALVLGLALLALGPRSGHERALGWTSSVAGAIGLALSAAAAGAVGVVLAASVLLVLTRPPWPRTVAIVAVVAIGSLGAFGVRSGEVERGIRALGIGSKPKASYDAASYVHRSLLAYIGLRMFADHPVVGVGWQGSEELASYGPYLAAAHRRFPGEPPRAFPSPAHAWGVQNAYLQTLTDLGIVGFAALAAFFATAVTLGVRAARRARPLALPSIAGLLWLLVAAGVWNGLGLVAGIPLDALTWYAVGLIGAAAAWAAP
jgi:O-antigen ligase